MPCTYCGHISRLRYEGNVTSQEFFLKSGQYAITDTTGFKKLDVYECDYCQLAFSPISIKQSDLDIFYKAQKRDDLYLLEKVGRLKTARRLLIKAGRLAIRSNGKLYDYGSGPGFLLAEAKKMGWKVAGAEISPWAKDYAKLEFGLELDEPESLELLPDESLDFITLCDVLEHLLDPVSLLKIVKNKIKQDGLVIITVPRYDSWLRKLLGKNWHAMFPAHLTYFTYEGLKKMLDQKGLEIIYKRSHLVYFSLSYLWCRIVCIFGGKPVYKQGLLSRLLIPINLGDELEIYARRKVN